MHFRSEERRVGKECRSRNALIKNGILYVEDLEKKKKGELLIMKWVGRKAIDEINVALSNLEKTLAG